MNIAVLGAPHTGKTVLVNALSLALRQRGHRVHLIAAENANAQHGHFDLALVCGLDLPLPVGQDTKDRAFARQATDSALRATLARQAVSFQVVYGTGPDRLSNALRSIDGFEVAQSSPVKAIAGTQEKWQSACDKCSDSACEHRLFTQLIG